MEAELVEAVNAFQGSETVSDGAKRGVEFLRKSGNKNHAHSRLCCAMIKRADGGNTSMEKLLHFAGQTQVLVIAYQCISSATIPTSKWLASEVLKTLHSGIIPSLLLSESKSDPTSSRLSPWQEELVGVVCRLPDVLANRLGRQLKEGLFPKPYFALLGEGVAKCLEEIHKQFQGCRHGRGYSLLFPATVLGTAASLGRQAEVLGPVMTLLARGVSCEEPKAKASAPEAGTDPKGSKAGGSPSASWSQLSCSLFSLLPPTSLEPVLETLVNNLPPSLLASSPFLSLIGRNFLTENHRARLILTHKLLLVRVPSSPHHALFTLLGCMATSHNTLPLLRKSVGAVLGVWSDPTSIRHMDRRQHVWISKIVVLGITLLQELRELEQDKAVFLKQVMAGVQAHIQSPLPEIRHVGMAVAEAIMTKLTRPSAGEERGGAKKGVTGGAKKGAGSGAKKGKGEGGKEEDSDDEDDDKPTLKFDYPASADTEVIGKLARPIAEQEAELQEERRRAAASAAERSEPESAPKQGEEGRGRDRKEQQKPRESRASPTEEVFGEGYVRTVDCSDTDSDDEDDEFVPYAFDDDPDSSQPTPPNYLRTLMQDLLNSKEPQKVEVALKTAEPLIRSQPYDLSEVCVEVCKILLHLSDSFALDDFVAHRHKAMVALAALCPRLVTPYLTTQFYQPNYSLRHRMDILEVISASALELSAPTSPTPTGPSPKAHPPAPPSHWSSRKPWEEIVSQRIKAKTRTISKGASKPPPTAVPNQFTDVAPLFFFPLMNQYDQRVNTLDLLGEDSLVLGNLLYALGTVMYAASHLPITVAMATAFLDFLWVLRFHHAVYVRQGVLYGLGMLISATPPHALMGELSTSLVEGVAWMKEVVSEDADEQCRVLAGHALTLLSTIMKEL